MNNFNKAIIQWNNVHWLMARASEGAKRGKVEAADKPEMDFVSVPLWNGRRINSQPCMIPQRIISLDRPSESSLFSGVLEALDTMDFLRNRDTEIPSECYSCANYSGSYHLKCAINPKRSLDEDCDDFEQKSFEGQTQDKVTDDYTRTHSRWTVWTYNIA